MPAASCEKPSAYYLIHFKTFLGKDSNILICGNNKQAASYQLPVADTDIQKIGKVFNLHDSSGKIIFKIVAIQVGGFSNF